MIKLIIIIILGAILNRWRGTNKANDMKYLNFFIKTKTPKLILMGFAYAGVLYTSESYTLTQCILAGSWMAGFMTIGWGLCFDMGRSKTSFIDSGYNAGRMYDWQYRWLNYFFGIKEEGWTQAERTYKDFIFMTMRGLLITCGAGIILANPIIAISGATMGVCYELGFRIKEKYNFFHGTGLAEYIYGGVLFGLAYISLILGG